MIHVRELPSLRLHIEAITPKGNRYRWGSDEPNPANIPAGLTFSSTMPGGYEQLDVSLARKAGIDYSDLARLSTLRVRGPGGDIAWEGRLERTPRTSGAQMAISPSAVGWQAHLDDDKGAAMIYRDVSLAPWANGPNATRRATVLLGGRGIGGGDATADGVGGVPSLTLSFDGAWGTVNGMLAEAYYAAPAGVRLARLHSAWTVSAGIGTTATYGLNAFTTDNQVTFPENVGDQLTGAASSGTMNFAPASPLRGFMLQLASPTGAGGTDGLSYEAYLTDVAVYGDHGLTLRGSEPDTGLYASDVVTHALGRWAPLLVIDGTVQASSFIIPHLTFPDATTAGEIVRQATSFGLQDWGVWDNRTFYWAQRGTYGRKWRARIAPAQLSETGPQLDRLWESVIVSYNDVDGTTRTVGPPDSDADTEDAALHDTDPENPANQLGIIRRDLLSMGTSTAAGAIELGRRFLEEQKLLDTSGQAQLVGHVMDDHGVLHPYWRVRAGDTISFVDASDTSERRIVRASHDHGSRTCTVDLDAPPEGLDALLARLGVVLVPLGVGA